MATPVPDREMSSLLALVDTAHERLALEIARPRRFDGTLRRRAAAESVEASTSIEGFRLPLAQAAEVLDSGDGGDNGAAAAVACYGRALDHVLMLASDRHFSWHLRVLLDLHFDITWFQWDNAPGHLRDGPVAITGPRGVVYRGPDADDVPPLMDELVEWLTGDDGHPLVRAAMAHLHLVSIHPYRDGNGRAARVLQSLLLAQAGILSTGFNSIEPYLARDTASYYAALQAAHGESPSEWTDGHDWVMFCLRAHLEQARERLDLLERAGKRWHALERVAAEHRWPDRLVIALEQASTLGSTSRRSYAREANVSPATASADLRRLIDAGLLTADGRGRAVRYLPSPTLHSLASS